VCRVGRSLCLMDLGNFIVWNVRGLNARARRDIMRELVVAERPSIVCLQETKLDVIFGFRCFANSMLRI
jgi:hypothetical protein